MKRLMIVAAASGIAMLGTAASAQPAMAPPTMPPMAVPAAPGGPARMDGMQRDQTRAQAQQRADRMFAMLDANHDGVVTRAEAQTALAQMQSMQAANGGGEGRGANRMQRMIDQAFATSPTMNLQQFEAVSLARFDAMDLNHDGVVTAAERAQVRAMRQGQGQ